MTQDRPLIEARRVRFSGLSAEAFPDLERGEQVTFTVIATCTATAEQDMKSEGERLTATMKVDKVSFGIDPDIAKEPDAEPNLFDEAEEDDEPETIGEIASGISEFQGPHFSDTGDDE
ncbi:hypothetical protein [Rhodococcus ruber]|uniref:hypothetical protein n=1 Tax=Rhodococcus ruber TaxID=1830 RepID=UPI003784E46D